MRNTLKLAEVPQTRQEISAISGLKFSILWGRVEEILLFNKFFQLSIHALVAKIWPDKVVWWCPDGEFLCHAFPATCSTFQTCILNKHWGHTICGSIVDIQSVTVRLGEEKKKEERKEKKPQDKNIMACLFHTAAIMKHCRSCIVNRQVRVQSSNRDAFQIKASNKRQM